MKSVVIIQARQGSSRLPNKVLHKLGKYSLIDWILIRLSLCRKIDEIICAIPNKNNYELFLALKELNKKIDFKIYQGSENNVHLRFKNALRTHLKSENLRSDKINVIRVCADRPFIDPILIDHLVEISKPDNLHFNHSIDGIKFGNGIGSEMVGYDLAQDLFFDRKELIDKEHVTYKIYKNCKRLLHFSIPDGYNNYISNLSNIITVVDTLKDYESVNKTIHRLNLDPNFLNLTKKLSENF